MPSTIEARTCSGVPHAVICLLHAPFRRLHGGSVTSWVSVTKEEELVSSSRCRDGREGLVYARRKSPMFHRLVLVLVLLVPATAFSQTQTTPVPMISAPVTGPGPMFPGLQRVPAGTGLVDQKYVVKEYFVSGTASGKPYTTRILVRQPEDPKRFTGIVVAEPMHASGNRWMFFFTRTYVMRHGYISVEIAPQKEATAATIVASNP